MEESELIQLAARGDRAAQAALASACMLKQGVGVPKFECAVMAEVFARLAAEHGQDDDLLILLGVLHVRAVTLAAVDPERSSALIAEVDSIIDRLAQGEGESLIVLGSMLSALADQGDEFAAVRLNRLMENLSPENVSALTNNMKGETAGMAEIVAGLTKE